MIKELTLTRFKKFENTTVKLMPFTILMGENSCGKTTILQAINLALNAFSKKELYQTDRKGKVKPRGKGVGSNFLEGLKNTDFRELYFAKKSRGTGNGEIGCSIEVVDVYDNRYKMQISSLFGNYNLTPTSKVTDFNENATLHNYEPLLISGFVGVNAQEERSLSLAIKSKLQNGDVSGVIRNLLYDTKEQVPENYCLLVNRLAEDFDFKIAEVDFSEKKDIYVKAYYSEKIEKQALEFDFSSSGSGFMQVLQILTAIYRYCPSSSRVVLLDEPDAHLHPNMQLALIESLRKVQHELGIQIILSTHSTAIIENAMPTEIIPVYNAKMLSALASKNEVEAFVEEHISSYDLGKAYLSGLIMFFEDSKIDYFIRCDQLLRTNLLSGSTTVAHMTGRTKDDRLPFSMHEVFKELLNRDISIAVIRDSDGIDEEIRSALIDYGKSKNVQYHILERYESENYMLNTGLIYKTIVKKNGECNVTKEEIEKKIISALQDTIRLSMYRYCSTLEDSIKKSSFVSSLDRYRNTNDYQSKARTIEDSYQCLDAYDDLIKHGMGKQALKMVFKWLNEECKVRISYKDLLMAMDKDDVPDEIRELFVELSQKRIVS